MIIPDEKFIEYVKVLKEELYRDPVTFVPKKQHKYEPEYYQKNKERFKLAYKRYKEKSTNE